MDSLKYWLEQIENNQDGDKLTHWEIEVLMTELIKFVEDSGLLRQIHPLLIAIRGEGKNHKHKSLIATFTLKLISQWEKIQNSPDHF